MERREFFRLGLRRITQGALEVINDASVEATWIRPPFAKAENDFLLGCTRCDRCILACPHAVLFRLPPRAGLKAAGTPAMDLDRHGCRLCADWPCVAACDPEVLLRPEGEALPRLAAARLEPASCLPYFGPECGACAGTCPVPGALVWDGCRPGLTEACIGCGLCRQACIATPKAVTIARRSTEVSDAP